MDLVQIALISVALLVVLFTIIYYAKHTSRSGKDKESPSVVPPAPAPGPAPAAVPTMASTPVATPAPVKSAPAKPAPAKPAPVKPAPKTRAAVKPVYTGPRQNTLYEFPYDVGIQLCPDCDAENAKAYRFCWVCGYKMP